MPVFHQHKLIFYHIGKTGGMSIERALGLPSGDYKNYRSEFIHGLNKGVMTQHARPNYVNNCMNTHARDTYYKFTVVRNPWDRMVSCYYYLYNINKNKFGDFSTWLKNAHTVVTTKSYREGDHLTPQLEYTHDTDGNQIVDQIGRFETLQTSYNTLCEQINIPCVELKLVNRSGKRLSQDHRDQYSDQDRELVREMYGEEIEQYGYAF